MYWSDEFPGPAIAFAFGLYVVDEWGRSLVDYGSRDIPVLCSGEE